MTNKKKPGANRRELTQAVVAVIRDWPRIEEFLRIGDCGGHPQQFVDEMVEAFIQIAGA